MTSEQKAELEKLIQAGVPQYLICQQLGVGRGVVQNFRRSHGLLGKKPGVPLLELNPEEQKEALRRLEAGEGTLAIAHAMGVRAGAVRKFSEARGFKHSPGSSGYRLQPTERKKIIRAIKGRKSSLASIARTSSVSHQTIKVLARKTLGARLVGGGSGREGLRSYGAMRHFDKEEFPWLRKRAATNDDDFGRLAELIRLRCFHGRLPTNSASEICGAILQVIFADEKLAANDVHAFCTQLAGALQALEIAQSAGYVS